MKVSLRLIVFIGAAIFSSCLSEGYNYLVLQVVLVPVKGHEREEQWLVVGGVWAVLVVVEPLYLEGLTTAGIVCALHVWSSFLLISSVERVGHTRPMMKRDIVSIGCSGVIFRNWVCGMTTPTYRGKRRGQLVMIGETSCPSAYYV